MCMCSVHLSVEGSDIFLCERDVTVRSSNDSVQDSTSLVADFDPGVHIPEPAARTPSCEGHHLGVGHYWDTCKPTTQSWFCP